MGLSFPSWLHIISSRLIALQANAPRPPRDGGFSNAGGFPQPDGGENYGPGDNGFGGGETFSSRGGENNFSGGGGGDWDTNGAGGDNGGGNQAWDAPTQKSGGW
jgi:hypothetical protein